MLRRQPTGAAKTGKNRLHLDIAPPTDGHQDTEVERLIAFGGRRIDIGQGDVSWVVLADPEGNELCVLTPAETTARLRGTPLGQRNVRPRR